MRWFRDHNATLPNLLVKLLLVGVLVGGVLETVPAASAAALRPLAGQVGVAYNPTNLVIVFNAFPTSPPATLPYTFSIGGGNLPATFGLSSAGVLTGTPTSAGSFNFTVVTVDSSVPARSINSGYTMTVSKGLSSTTLAAAPSGGTSTLGQNVTFSATVSPSTATGSVTFKDGNTTLGTGPLGGGVATFSTTALTAGSHSITATYGSDANYLTSTSIALTQTIASATTTTLAPLAASTFGQNTVFSATIVPANATGTVTFMDGTTVLGAGTLSGGVATFSTTTLTAGSHSITALYGGDSNNATSTSSVVTLTVAQAALPTGAATTSPTSTSAPASPSGGSTAPKPAPTPVLTRAEATAAAIATAAPLVAAAAPAVAPTPVAPPAPVVSAPAPLVAPGIAPSPAVVPDTSTRFTAPLAPSGARAAAWVPDRVVVQPTNPTDFLAQIPDGMRIAITADNEPLPSDVNPAQLGSLGGGDALRLAPPIELQLVARDIASGAQVPLPDGALAQTYLVSLPVIAEPANAGQTFTWLVAVQEDGHFLGYMRYPSTFDSQTNSLNFELTGHGVQAITALPVILQPSKVQAFESDVHTWSSPFKDGVDFGVVGPVWTAYAVLAPQVGERIGILSPDGKDMLWIDASGVGPAGNATADNPPPPVPDGVATPPAVAVAEPDGAAAP